MNTTTISDATQDEALAARALLEGDTVARMRIAHGALRRLFADHNDTHQVLVLSLAVNAGRMPELMARFLANDVGAELYASRATIDTTAVDYAALRALPADTLGGAYVRFLDDNGLDPDLFQAPPGLPEVPAYIAKRMRQSHDIWHVVTGCSPDVPGELELLAFSYAQTHLPAFALLATAGSLRFGLRHPGVWRRVLRGYQNGKKASFMGPVAWERMWTMTLEQVRAALGVDAINARAAA
jgi:ubiquinone biosynthesis protein COQ4